MNPPVKIAIAGLGTVGGGVVKALTARGNELSERVGRAIEIVGVSARDSKKARGFAMPGWTDNPMTLAHGEADVVIELIGGAQGVARELVEAALGNGKHVVTANKALLAEHGAHLAALADKNKCALKFEAAVAGGIPIVKALRESLIAYGVDKVRGILNGTCNYILTQMETTGSSFSDVLKEAQRLGYAEADPTLDIGGGDTAHKIALLASLAFGTLPSMENVFVEGIAHITPDDIRFASEFGFRIKLLGVAQRRAHGIEQRVQPVLVRTSSPLAHTDGASNAVVADAGAAGRFFFAGRGAGEAPTAGAVIADLMDIARGDLGPAFGRPAAGLQKPVAAPSGEALSAYYLRFEVSDQPGVLAEIAGYLSQAQDAIESMIQRGRGEPVCIVMITHEASHNAVTRALKAIAASDKVRARPCMIPMEAA